MTSACDVTHTERKAEGFLISHEETPEKGTKEGRCDDFHRDVMRNAVAKSDCP